MAQALFLTKDELQALRENSNPTPPIWKSPLGLPLKPSQLDGAEVLYVYPADFPKPHEDDEEALLFTLKMTAYLASRLTPCSLKVHKAQIVHIRPAPRVLAVLSQPYKSLANVSQVDNNDKRMNVLAKQLMRMIFQMARRGIFHGNICADNTFVVEDHERNKFVVMFSGFKKTSTFLLSEDQDFMRKDVNDEVPKVNDDVPKTLTMWMTKLLIQSLTDSSITMILKNLCELIHGQLPHNDEIKLLKIPFFINFLNENKVLSSTNDNPSLSHDVNSSAHADMLKTIFEPGNKPPQTLMKHIVEQEYNLDQESEIKEAVLAVLRQRGWTTIK